MKRPTCDIYGCLNRTETEHEVEAVVPVFPPKDKETEKKKLLVCEHHFKFFTEVDKSMYHLGRSYRGDIVLRFEPAIPVNN